MSAGPRDISAGPRDMSAEPLIELGDLGADPPEPDRPPRPGSWWRTRRAGQAGQTGQARPVPRWLPLLAVSLAVVLGAGGSALPRPGLVPLATLPYGVGAMSAIGTDTVFIDLHGVVNAYDLESGARRWSAPAPGSTDGLQLAESAGVLLVSLSDQPVATLALDTRTGRRLWRLDGEQPGAVLPDERMSLLYTVSPLGSSMMRGVETRTGRTVWVRPQPSSAAYFGPWTDPSEQAPRVVFQEADRSVEVVDAATGAVVVRGPLAGVPPPDPANTEDRTALSVVGDLLLSASGDDSHRISAFDLNTLTPKWTVSLPGGGFVAASCGPVLCVYGNQALTGLDPVTGALRWFTRAWNDVANPLPRNRLVVQSGDQSAQAAIVSATDLRPVLGLRGWYPFVDQVRGGPLVLARDVSALWTWFAVVDPAEKAPVVYPLGQVRGVFRQDCSARGGHLICPTVHNVLQVWWYRR